MTVRALDVIECNLHDDGGFDAAAETAVLDGVLLEVFGKLQNFGVGQPRIGFADGDQPVLPWDAH